MEYVEIIKDLIERDEEEWFEFKENWFNKEEVGMYISALSNAAALCGKEYGYLVWGISDKDHQIKGTSIKYHCDFKGEPFQNYLARNLTPSIAFEFQKRCPPLFAKFVMDASDLALLTWKNTRKEKGWFGEF